MSAQSVSIAAMFGWVVDSFKLLKKNIFSLMSASLVTLVLVVLMMAPMMVFMVSNMMDSMKNGAPPMASDMTMFYATYAISVVLSLLLFPPLLVGWFRLCQNIDKNNAVSGLDILKPYKDSRAWLRSLGFALLAFLIYISVFALVALVFGEAFSEGIQQMVAQQASAMSGAPPAPPVLPMGFLLGYFSFIAIAMFLQFIYLLGFAEVSLRETSVFESMKLATVGTFKNILQLIVFLIGISIAFFIVIFIFALVLGLIVGLLSLIHPIIGGLVALMLYIPFLLCMYPLMFAGQYFVWKSILGSENSPALPNNYDSSLSV